MEVFWKVAVGPGGSFLELCLIYKGWSFSTKKNERMRKYGKSATNLKNVAVALVLFVFLKNCCCNQQTGGVPLPFVHLGTIILSFTHKTNGFLMVLGCPRGPRREKTGVGGGICHFVAAQPRAFSQQIPREVLGRWKDPYPKGRQERRKEGRW